LVTVTVKFFGPLSQQTGQGSATFSLAPGATYGHLLEEIDRSFGPLLHTGLWDSDRKMFKAGILVIGTGRDLTKGETPLKDGEEIKIVPLLGGG
jgi:molybdopterin converting factor small subunit